MTFYLVGASKSQTFWNRNIGYQPSQFQISWLSGCNFMEVGVQHQKTQLWHDYDWRHFYHWLSKLTYFVEHDIGYQSSKFQCSRMSRSNFMDGGTENTTLPQCHNEIKSPVLKNIGLKNPFWFSILLIFHPIPTNFEAKRKVVLLPAVLLLISAYISIKNWMKFFNLWVQVNPNLWRKTSRKAGRASIFFLTVHRWEKHATNVMVVCVSLNSIHLSFLLPYMLHPLFFSQLQIINSQGHERFSCLLHGRLWVGWNETLDWAQHVLCQFRRLLFGHTKIVCSFFTVISMVLKNWTILFWLSKAWKLTGKRVTFFRKFCTTGWKKKVRAIDT